MANTASPWGEVYTPWLHLSLLCTIELLSCVTSPLRILTRRVARARRIVRVAPLPHLARWVVRSWLKCFPEPWAWNHSWSLSRKTASATCWFFAILATLISFRRLFTLGDPIHDFGRTSLEGGRDPVHPCVVEGCRCRIVT